MVRSQSSGYAAGCALFVKIPDCKRKKRFFKSFPAIALSPEFLGLRCLVEFRMGRLRGVRREHTCVSIGTDELPASRVQSAMPQCTANAVRNPADL